MKKVRILLVIGILSFIPFTNSKAQSTSEKKYKDRYCLFGGDRCVKEITYWNGEKVAVKKLRI